MSEPVMNEAQNTEAPATTDNSSPATPAAEDNTILGAAEGAEQNTQGNEGTEANAPAGDEAPSEQDENSETKDAEPEGAPEEYEAFTMPEGFELDSEVGGELNALAKELNLSQQDAQRLADLGVKQASKLADQPAKAVAEARVEWKNQAQNDKEFGGANMDKNMSTAKRAMDSLGTPELKTLLNESGLGNHPEVIRVFYRAGKAMSEDTMVTGTSGNSQKPVSAADRLYGNNNN